MVAITRRQYQTCKVACHKQYRFLLVCIFPDGRIFDILGIKVRLSNELDHEIVNFFVANHISKEEVMSLYSDGYRLQVIAVDMPYGDKIRDVVILQ